MKLKDLIKQIDPLKVVGSVDVDISDLVFDSRKVRTGSLFFAIKGTQVDGHQYIAKAIDKGAIAIVCETLPQDILPNKSYLQVALVNEAMGQMASQFYGAPSTQLNLVGVTGTNGKTTTVTLLHDLFSGLGYKCGLLSTIQNKVGNAIIESQLTTPDVITINALLREMVDAGCDYAFMEVSSHAVDQRRIAGLVFKVAVFTNMSHDHLDYHKTFDAYIKAKKRFFDDLPKSADALINLDDKRGRVMVQNTKAKVQTYSMQRMADYRVRVLDNSLMGLHLMVDQQEVFTQFIGDFNAYNLLAAYAVASILEQDSSEVLQVMSQLRAAEGRFDYVKAKDQKTVGIVDYSHTPDALEKVLKTINAIRKQQEKIITVVGAGGDRDKAKRPKMAAIACNYSSEVILTSDNPRTEAPEAIIRDMEQGIPLEKQHRVLSITDRRQAIKTACRLAKPGDIILVAGKGHEKYQEINGVKYPFDDKAILKEELAN